MPSLPFTNTIQKKTKKQGVEKALSQNLPKIDKGLLDMFAEKHYKTKKKGGGEEGWDNPHKTTSFLPPQISILGQEGGGRSWNFGYLSKSEGVLVRVPDRGY